MRCAEPIVLACLVVAAGPAYAADQDVLEDVSLLSAEHSSWILTAGGELDGDGGYLVGGSAAFSPRERTSFSLHGAYSDTPAVGAPLTATVAGLDFDQSFEHWGFALSAGYWKDPELVEAADYGGSVFLKGGGWRLTASAEARASDFNAFAINGTIPRPNLPPITVTGQASCALDNVGLGGRLSFTAQRWSGYLAGKSYDYDSFDCRISSLNIGGLRITAERLRAVSPVFLQRLTLLATAAG